MKLPGIIIGSCCLEYHTQNELRRRIWTESSCWEGMVIWFFRTSITSCMPEYASAEVEISITDRGGSLYFASSGRSNPKLSTPHWPGTDTLCARRVRSMPKARESEPAKIKGGRSGRERYSLAAASPWEIESFVMI